MRFYLSHPGNQMHAAAVQGMPVLVSYAGYADWMDRYLPSFGRLLIDSGAYSELTGRAKVDLAAYAEWAPAVQWADAWAGLDDIGGDWRRSLKNYESGGFPTMHEADPPELLDDLLEIARLRGGWIGVGLTPPRHGKERIVRAIIERIPDEYHVHGWALGEYAWHPRLDSVDSTNAWLDVRKVLQSYPYLTPAEALDVVVKRYVRVPRMKRADVVIPSLFHSEVA